MNFEDIDRLGANAPMVIKIGMSLMKACKKLPMANFMRIKLIGKMSKADLEYYQTNLRGSVRYLDISEITNSKLPECLFSLMNEKGKFIGNNYPTDVIEEIVLPKHIEEIPPYAL